MLPACPGNNTYYSAYLPAVIWTGWDGRQVKLQKWAGQFLINLTKKSAKITQKFLGGWILVLTSFLHTDLLCKCQCSANSSLPGNQSTTGRSISKHSNKMGQMSSLVRLIIRMAILAHVNRVARGVRVSLAHFLQMRQLTPKWLSCVCKY